jgi:2-aminobenzoate-CoA ligase
MLRSPKVVLTYAQACSRVSTALPGAHARSRVVPGNRVLLRGGNSIGMALAWLAVVKAGLVAVATMPLLRAKELGDIIDKSPSRGALCDAKLLEELGAGAGAATRCCKTIVPFNVSHPRTTWLDWPRAAPRAATLQGLPHRRDDIALLAFTSGTTGKPKAAVHSHRDVLAACETWPRHVLRPHPDDIVMGSPPLAFTFGLGGLLIFPMWAGASVYFPDIPYTPEVMAG